jgi:hypothetical protein
MTKRAGNDYVGTLLVGETLQLLRLIAVRHDGDRRRVNTMTA